MPSTSPPGGLRKAAGAGRPLLLLALLLPVWASASPPALASANCVDGSANEARVAGSDEGPPKLTPAFFRRVMTIVASTAGLSEDPLPISIAPVCGLPRPLPTQ